MEPTGPEPGNVLPALDSATESALRESIRRFGVLVPVIHDQEGNLVDGHHRSRLARELGKPEPMVVVLHMPDDPEQRAAMLADVNDARRPRMSIEHRRAIVAHLRAEGHSTRAIAGAVGVAQPTVLRDLQIEPTDTSVSVDLPDRITGLDGRDRPARRAERGEDDRPPSARTWKRNPADQISNIIARVEGFTQPLGNTGRGARPTTDQLIDVGAAISASDKDCLVGWDKNLTEAITRLIRLRAEVRKGMDRD